MHTILRAAEVRRVSGLSRSSLYLRIEERLFPKPIKLGPRMVGWPESDVAALIAARIRGDSEDAIRKLVSRVEFARKDAA